MLFLATRRKRTIYTPNKASLACTNANAQNMCVTLYIEVILEVILEVIRFNTWQVLLKIRWFRLQTCGKSNLEVFYYRLVALPCMLTKSRKGAFLGKEISFNEI